MWLGLRLWLRRTSIKCIWRFGSGLRLRPTHRWSDWAFFGQLVHVTFLIKKGSLLCCHSCSYATFDRLLCATWQLLRTRSQRYLLVLSPPLPLGALLAQLLCRLVVVVTFMLGLWRLEAEHSWCCVAGRLWFQGVILDVRTSSYTDWNWWSR